MTDRELLKLAAKAAGILNYTVRGENIFVETGSARGASGFYWNPLDDDGDALRLAVKLKIDIEHLDSDVHSYQNHTHLPDWADSSFAATETADEGDPHAAARRAIVRSAAQIGRRDEK
jgi:hypothetical protein